MIQQTSLKSYITNILPTLGDRQMQVLSFFQKFPDRSFSNLEASHYIGLPINNITARVNELRKKGMLKCAGKRICYFSGREVLVWQKN